MFWVLCWVVERTSPWCVGRVVRVGGPSLWTCLRRWQWRWQVLLLLAAQAEGFPRQFAHFSLGGSEFGICLGE
jgi:hypothetical protein